MQNATPRRRPERHQPAARQIARPMTIKRAVEPSDIPSASEIARLATPAADNNPYVDYGRSLTPEGGIIIIYKDIDDSLWHILWQIAAFCAFTIPEMRFLFYHSPVHSLFANFLCFLGIVIVNYFIVAPHTEVYHSIEIRPDCMIINGSDVFWRKYMECGWPCLSSAKEDGQVLAGIYGTRFVEYLTIRKCDTDDKFDRTQAVFESHLKDAMRQLWSRLL
jgi:hypothetical protein